MLNDYCVYFRCAKVCYQLLANITNKKIYGGVGSHDIRPY